MPDICALSLPLFFHLLFLEVLRWCDQQKQVLLGMPVWFDSIWYVCYSNSLLSTKVVSSSNFCVVPKHGADLQKGKRKVPEWQKKHFFLKVKIF